MSCMSVLVARAIDLQVISKTYLQEQGEMRHVDEITVSAYRGIDDRSQRRAVSYQLTCTNRRC